MAVSPADGVEVGLWLRKVLIVCSLITLVTGSLAPEIRGRDPVRREDAA